MRNSGAPGYKYISVDEDEAANVIYCNNTLIHLDPIQIPKGSAVSMLLPCFACCSHKEWVLGFSPVIFYHCAPVLLFCLCFVK